MLDIENLELLDFIPEGLFSLREDFTVFFWNKTMEVWTKLSRQNVLGKSINEVFPHFAEPKYANVIKRIFSGGPPAFFSPYFHKGLYSSPLSNEENHVYETVITSIKYKNRESTCVLFAIKDITDSRYHLDRYKEAVKKHQQLEQSLLEINAQLQQKNEELSRISALDSLTGISNRRALDEYLGRAWNLAMRNNMEISSIFIDVDYFKLFNDSYGHQAGDKCLQDVACVIKETIKRPTDLAARYGGEEFVALLVGTGKESAVRIAEEIRNSVEILSIPHKHSVICGHVTISLGVATLTPTRNMSPSALIRLSDIALYAAKQSGRNQVMS